MEGYKDGGLKTKFIVSKASGEPTDPNADYFVLRLDKDPHARKALFAYALSVQKDNPILSEDIKNKLDKEYNAFGKDKVQSMPVDKAYVLITISKYLELDNAETELLYLQSCGVDNWEPGISREEYAEQNGMSKFETTMADVKETLFFK